MYRSTTPLSHTSTNSFGSFSNAPTPEPHGLSPAPRRSRYYSTAPFPLNADTIRRAPGGLPYDENVRPPASAFHVPPQQQQQQNVDSPQKPERPTGLRPSTSSVGGTGPLARCGTPSSNSGASGKTWFSAVGSVTEEIKVSPIKKTDSGIGLEESSSSTRRTQRRESASSGSTTARKKESKSRRGPEAKRCGRSSAGGVRRTSSDTMGSYNASSSSMTTLRPRHHGNAYNGSPTESLQQGWRSPNHEPTRRRNNRAEQETSPPREPKYHRNSSPQLSVRSRDSLCPVVHNSKQSRSKSQSASTSSSSSSAYSSSSSSSSSPSWHSITTPMEKNPSQLVNVASLATTAVTAPTIIDWKSNETRRREYEAADRRKRSVWAWIRRKLLCAGDTVDGREGDFWEDGMRDGGSVRRYRIALPVDEEPQEEAGAEEKTEQKDKRKVSDIDVELANGRR